MTPFYLRRQATAARIGAVLRSPAVLAYRRLPTSFGFFAAPEMAAFVLIATLLLGAEAFKIGTSDQDLVKNIPGLLYNVSFNVYSGYLDAGKHGPNKNDAYMHYMLTESKSNPSTDPILLWLNGGPGCSSFSGAFEEMGPFYVNKDGQTLYENIYAWNSKANVLYLESPIGVGYSFLDGVANYTDANDDQTLQQNFAALNSFFTKFTQYENRKFFIAGESYAGVYLPMLGDAIMSGIINKTFVNPNFAGIAIGNGYMDIVGLQNSLVLWSFYHGRIGLDDWKTLKSDECCIQLETGGADTCDFVNKSMTTKTWNDFFPRNDTICGKILFDVISKPARMDPYNYYEDCYDCCKYYHNTASIINYNYTDFLFGYPCWQEGSVAKYFDRPDVQDAFHLTPAKLVNFTDCNGPMYDNYVNTYHETKKFFKGMFGNVQKANLKNFKILIYNGDVDTVCNFLGDAKFIDGVTNDNGGFTHTPRVSWSFRNKRAGFVQNYKGSLSIDVLTVKGAGHMVPLDRPGPSMQMINAFLNGKDYSDTQGVNMIPTPVPLNAQQPTQPPVVQTTGAGESLKSSFAVVLSAIMALFVVNH
ncbi:hypothetical protein L596_008964 [Steinernema carpocapsae]|uniref:Carboxypeptidase n=1 Tax=Steinernema carpocapsae TaxID=34508 RepID=A0A4U5PDZ6_STECR|nr:hypothetical protein L596_008964 [Steinernema carpocapsae]